MVAPATPEPPIFFVFVFEALIVTSAEQVADTVMVVQFVTDSLFEGAVAEAVIMSPATRPVIPVAVQVPEATVADANETPFLKMVIVVPLASDDVPLIVVELVVIEVATDGQDVRSAGNPVFMPVTGVGKKFPMTVSNILS